MISIILPILDEQESIESVIEQIKQVMNSAKECLWAKGYEILVIDDGSTDNTPKILRGIQDIKVITHPYNKGYGSAIKTGIRNSKFDYILIMDADKTYDPKNIPDLLKYIPEYDMVIGNREKQNIPFVRKPAKWILQFVANKVSPRHIPDLNSGMRIFKKQLALNFFEIFPSGFSFTTTITLAALTNDYNVKYVPIEYHERTGTSKMKSKHFFDFIILLINMTTYFNPLKIFIPATIILFVFSLIRSIRDIWLFNTLDDLSVILILATFQIFFLGILANLISKKTNWRR